MTEQHTPAYRYAGFISYSQQDKKYAKKIHAALEAFKLPVELAQAGRKHRKVGKFFRDDDELSGSPSLGAALTGALNDSAALIVIASPRAAQSKWVDKEIRHFKAQGKNNRVFAIIVDGLPDTEDESQRCFPPSLLWEVDANGDLTDQPDEPLAPDLRKEPFDRLITKLVAGLLNLNFDGLWQRERRRIQRKRAILAMISISVATMLGAAGLMYQNAENERLRVESSNLAAQAQELMSLGKKNQALDLVLRALPADLASPDRPVVPEALVALRNLMTDSLAQGLLRKFNQHVREMHLLSPTHLGVWLEDFSTVTLDIATGKTVNEDTRYVDGAGFKWLPDTPYGTYIHGGPAMHRIEVVNLIDGKTQYSASFSDYDWYPNPIQQVFSPSGQKLFVQRSDGSSDLAVWSMGAGANQGEPIERVITAGPSLGKDDDLSARFVDDNQVLLAWGVEEYGYVRRFNLSVWDLKRNQILPLAEASAPIQCASRSHSSNSDDVDVITVSSDRQFVSLSRPLQGSGACVQRWQTSDWQPLPTLYFEKETIGAVETFADGSMLGGRGVGTVQFAGPQSLSAEEQTGLIRPQAKMINPCGYPSRDNFYPDHGRSVYHMDAANSLMACQFSNTKIAVLSGAGLAQKTTLPLHSAPGRGALALHPKNKLLYAANDFGEIRVWDLSRIAKGSTLPKGLNRLISAADRLVGVLSPGNAPPSVLLMDEQLMSLVMPLYFHDQSYYDTAREHPHHTYLEQHVQLVPQQGVMAMIEGPRPSVCIGESCNIDIEPTPTDMKLIHLSTGQTIATLGNLTHPDAYAISQDGKLLAYSSRPNFGLVMLIDSLTGQETQRIDFTGRPEAKTSEVNIQQLAFINQQLWVLVSAQPGGVTPGIADASNIWLYAIGSNGPELKFTAQGHSADLILSPSGNQALIVIQPTYDGDTAQWAHLNASGQLREFSDSRLNHDFLRSNYYHFNDAGDVLVLQASRPVLKLMTKNLTLQEIGPVLSERQIGRFDFERFELQLPKTTLLGVVQDDQLSLLELSDAIRPLCPALQGMSGSAGSLSPDGGRLAVSDWYNSGNTKVYNLATCTVEYETSFYVYRSQQMHFVSPTRLVLADDKGAARTVDLSETEQSLYERAKQLARGLTQ